MNVNFPLLTTTSVMWGVAFIVCTPGFGARIKEIMNPTTVITVKGLNIRLNISASPIFDINMG